MTAYDGPAAWVRLAGTPGVGRETARKLLGAFGLPENIFSASRSALCEVVSERIAASLAGAVSAELHGLIERTLEWQAAPGNRMVTLADADYPPLLLNIPDPPLLFYAKGNCALLSELSVAIVGSRNATAQGVQNAEKFAASLSSAGLHTVSGLALGIDGAAHRGSLQTRTSGQGGGSSFGSTVAVIGTGIDIVYPARHRELAHAIAAHGCIVSEYALGTPAIAANFPRRNRIISGLARGTLVVEAAVHSGSLITARTAIEQGREVFAVPGSIHSPLAKGCHQLIRQGAKLVESAQDILEELTPFLSHAPVAAAPEAAVQTEHPLLAAMGYDPVDADTLAARCGLDLAALNARLLDLELDGLIEVLPGNTYRRLQ